MNILRKPGANVAVLGCCIHLSVTQTSPAAPLLSRAARRAAQLKKIESKKCAYEVCPNK